jgi:hypothetical protein
MAALLTGRSQILFETQRNNLQHSDSTEHHNKLVTSPSILHQSLVEFTSLDCEKINKQGKLIGRIPRRDSSLCALCHRGGRWLHVQQTGRRHGQRSHDAERRGTSGED